MGTVDGSFFKAPTWIDLKKQPGTTPQTPLGWSKWFWGAVSGRSLIYSPNAIWLSFAIMDYLVFPYDLNSAKAWSSDWLLWRFGVNYAIMMTYYGFWHGSLYHAKWSSRKFRPDLAPSSGNLAHNLWYTSLGTAQYTVWEAMFMYAYANDKLGYVSDAELLSSPKQMAMTLVWTAAIPVWRGMHFYFAHRFVHIRAIYKYVHSLHHRNGDIEPFAGLCMHPIEHLYYFSCLAPTIYFRCSPFITMWNGMHLMLSPACSHSGWEDHVQSDQFHYLHHARFECNYGSASMPLDHWFGTFRDKMGESKTYKGEGSEATKASPFKIQSSWAFSVYMAATAVLFTAFGVACDAGSTLAGHPHGMAAALAFGPIFFGLALYTASGDKQSMRWPFQKEPIVGHLHQSFGFNALCGLLFAVVPVYHLALAVLGECSACA